MAVVIDGYRLAYPDNMEREFPTLNVLKSMSVTFLVTDMDDANVVCEEFLQRIKETTANYNKDLRARKIKE